jgi:hypothetical protein
MFPQLHVYLDDQAEPRIIETQSLDFWTYEDLVAKDPRAKTSEHGMRLTIAFLNVEGRDPKNLDEVKLWAREHRARITLGRDVDPTQSDHDEDS